MAKHSLSDNFKSFFKTINPSPTFEQIASREYSSIKSLIEHREGLAGDLEPRCFLQGSYRQDTAIYSINDVDIVAICTNLWQPGSGTGTSWSRDEIFDTIAAPLLNSARYADKVKYRKASMCIKVDLGIKVEILPVVCKAGKRHDEEPFRLYRPENEQWEDGYAKYHQTLLSRKNNYDRTEGNFIPAIKVFKHINTIFGVEAVSFHIEGLLYSLPDHVFIGSPADYINDVINYIVNTDAEDWYKSAIKTPCKDRFLFISTEWNESNWSLFHDNLDNLSAYSNEAVETDDRDYAIECWQRILGEEYFPSY